MSRLGTQRGFTLLEVFIATAILGISIVYFLDALTHSPDRANRAKLRTVATMLAQTKLTDVEADLMRDGWEDFDDEECGDFKDEEYGEVDRYEWCARIETIELPDSVNIQDIVSSMLGTGDEDEDGERSRPAGGGLADNLMSLWMGGAGGLGGMAGQMGQGAGAAGGPTQGSNPMASLLASFLAPFRNVVEQAIRRVTLRVFWTYRGKEESVALVYYVTRAEMVEQAIIGGFMQSMAAGAQGGASPAGGGGGSKK